MSNLSSQELTARLILHSVPNIGGKRFLKLIKYFGTANAALNSYSQWHETGMSAYPVIMI